MPSIQNLLIRATLVNDRDTLTIPLDVQRRDWEKSCAQAVLPEGASVEAVEADGISCEWVSLPPHDRSRAVVFLHGGGFVSGSCRTHRELAARIAASSGVSALVVEYRLAPEHPFPAALEDAQAVYRWLMRQGIPPKNVLIGGDSSGGGLAVAAMLALRDSGVSLPIAALLLSPLLDLALEGESLESRARIDPLISREGLQACIPLYVGKRDPRNALISPVYADLRGLPPLMIQVGDHEVLLSDSIRLADHARKASVDVDLEVWPEMWHVWHTWAGEMPEGEQAIHRIGEYIIRILEKGADG